MDSQAILAKKNITDLEKLMMIFELYKDNIKKDYPELYYTLLGVRNDIKVGYKFIK